MRNCRPAQPGELHPLSVCPAGRARAWAGEEISAPTTPLLHGRDGPLWPKDIIQPPLLLYRDANKRASCAPGLEVFFKNNDNKSLTAFRPAQLTSPVAHHLLKPLCRVLGWGSPGWPHASTRWLAHVLTQGNVPQPSKKPLQMPCIATAAAPLTTEPTHTYTQGGDETHPSVYRES